MNLLQAPYVLPTRRNHALEHATIHLLSARFPTLSIGGHSNPTGFFIVGNIPTQALREAVNEALTRLQNGEHSLAIHPGCGTNYLVYGSLAGIFSMLGMIGTRNSRERWDRLPLIIFLSALGFLIGQPLGPALQKQVTTDPHLNETRIVDIRRVSNNLHRVITH